MINDRLGQILTASNSYKLALEKCTGDPNLEKSQIYKKAGTNYAVTLEKLNEREKAIKQLAKLNQVFTQEVKVYNNLGIIQKREGNLEAALDCYQRAIQIEPTSFFPNYNMGVLLSHDRVKHSESIKYLKTALA